MRANYLMLALLAMPAMALAVSPTPVQPVLAKQVAAAPASTLAAATRQIETYFNSLTTLQASFVQTQTDRPREAQRGVVYISRPTGQFLWQYVSPVKQKIVGTGTAVYYVDQSATRGDGQVTQLPLDAGLGRLLRGAPLSLSKVGLRVTKVSQAGGQRVIDLLSTQARQDQQGLRGMSLTFNAAGKTPVLASFAATDTLGVTTQISLAAHQPGVKLAKNLFAFTPGVYRER